MCVPNILILGHSFVCRLRDDLAARFDARAWEYRLIHHLSFPRGASVNDGIST